MVSAVWSPNTSRPMCAAFAVIVVALFALATMPAGQAQMDPQSESLVPDAVHHEVVLVDPPEDVAAGSFLVYENTPAATDVDAAIDIVSVAFAETASHIRISLAHRAYPDHMATLSEATPTNSIFCAVEFQINGLERVHGTRLFGETFLDGGPYRFRASGFTYGDDPGGDWDWENLGELPVALVNNDHLEISVPKELVGVGAAQRELKVGDRVSSVWAYCARSPAPFVSISDFAYAEDVVYRFQEGAGTDTFALLMPVGVGETVSLAAGDPSRVVIGVENLERQKLLVNLTARVVDAAGNDLAGWDVKNAATLEVAKRRTGSATLVITPPADATHREGGILQISAFAVGHEGTAVAKRSIAAAIAPSPERNILYFHNSPDYFRQCLPSCDLPATLIDFDPPLFELNVLETDPVYDREVVGTNENNILEIHSAAGATDVPLAQDIRLDGDGTVTLQVALRASAPAFFAADWSLASTNGDFIAGGVEDFELSEQFQEFTFSSPVIADQTKVPSGSDLELRFFLEDEGTPLFGGASIVDVYWDPARSQLELPLLPVVKEQVNITDGRALPSIHLGNLTEAEEYLNPGSVHAFDLLLANEGTEEDILELAADVSLPGWKVTFEPGKRFALESGQVAPLCLGVEAPEDVAEGTVAIVNLTALSENDDEARTSMSLRLIVTEGVEIDPAPCTEVEEDEYVEPLSSKEKEAPGFGLVLPIIAAGGIAWARRRR